MPEVKTDLVCTGCSLLCDDIIVEVEDGKILHTHHICARGYGRHYQVNFKYRILKPTIKATRENKEISYEEALQEIVSLLKNAKNPFFYGWASATSEAQQKGIQLAQKYSGLIDSASTFTTGSAVQQFIQKEIKVPKLSFIKDNADVLLFWGSNPTASHIRLLSKYALLARGLNTDRGIEDRQAITLDIRRTDMSKFCPNFLIITPGKDKILLESLIQIIQGKSFSEESVANISRKDLYEIAGIIKEAGFGVVFFGNGFVKTDENMGTLFHFLDILNQKGVKFGAIPLDGGYNSVGFNMNLKKQVNLELNADFRKNPPIQNRDLFVTMLKKGKIDLLFVLGSDPISNFPFNLSKLIAKIPIITIDFQQTPTTKISKVVIPTTIPGVESDGTAYRLDFEPITLKKFLNPPNGIHSDDIILFDLLEMS
ncbi:MAG: formylmethanofuran dehydrogenase subunit B [Candidatus Helarchaeota archaeon]|nr:formylmethanofuran dehydrogenase subunit B [Candidatus Helarchaeota archaeon]